MTSRQELLDAYVALWEENGEPPGSVQVNLKTDFYVSDYTETLGVEFEEIPDLCRAENLVESEDENSETQQRTQEASEEEREAADDSGASTRPVADSVNDHDFELEGPQITDKTLAKGSFGPRPELSVRLAVYELHRELDRPLHPTDLVHRVGLSTEDISTNFDSWTELGRQADIPVVDANWSDTLVRELRLARTRMENQRQSIHALHQFMHDRLELLFPDTDDIQTELREQLNRLGQDRIVQFEREPGMYSIVCDPVELSPVASETTASTAETPPSEVQLQLDNLSESLDSLESLCSVLERQLRYDANEKAAQTLGRLHQEMKSVDISSVRESSESYLQLRFKTVQRRVARAGDAIESRNVHTQTGKHRSRHDLIAQLQELTDIFGETPRAEVAGLCGEYPVEAYMEEFGSWQGAIDAAGLDGINESDRALRMYDRPSVLKEMVRIIETLGTLPSHSQVSSHADFTYVVARDRLGGWKNALRFAKALSETEVEQGSPESESSHSTESSDSRTDTEEEADDSNILVKLRSDFEKG